MMTAIDISTKEDANSNKSIKLYLLLGSILFVSIAVVSCIYYNFPQLDEEDRAFMKLPRNVEDIKNLGRILDRYKDEYYIEVMAILIYAYIFLQTFAIPGSISLSIISGFLYPFPIALSIICFCSATGASLCYLLSYNFGRRLVQKYFPKKVEYYSNLVQKHRNDMFNYIVFLRVTPLLPNWFINISAPVVQVPFLPFWLGTFVGVAPPSFVAVQTGKTLQELTSIGGTWSWNSLILLVIFAIISIIPVFLKNRFRSKIE